MTRMYHPEHGWTHAYSAQEVKQLESHGWKVEGEKPPLTVVPIRKPGRPKKVA